jgi:hypothetical protein
MSLVKQLYIIISFLFLSIFIGNFLITVQNTKEYLEEESHVKAQDSATSLGLLLSKYIADKNDVEISLIIKAVSDRGFYKEVKLVDAFYTFSQKDLLDGMQTKDVVISNVRVDSKIGKIINNNDNSLESELNALENTSYELSDNSEVTYTFDPAQDFQDGTKVVISYDYTKRRETFYIIKRTFTFKSNLQNI